MKDILHGRRILITRTRDQASALVNELRKLEAVPIIVPTIEIVPPASFADLDSAISNTAIFDWLLFTSANAVHAWDHRAAALSLSPSVQRLAAIGPSTAQAIHASTRLHSDSPVLVPPMAIAESLAETLVPFITESVSRGARASVALIRAEAARDHLPQTLSAAGATVVIVPAYRTILPASSLVLIREVFGDPAGAPDAITFTSSSTATNFVDLLAAAGATLPPHLLRVSIGSITSQTLVGLGLTPHAQASAPTIPALIEALRQAISQSGGGVN